MCIAQHSGELRIAEHLIYLGQVVDALSDGKGEAAAAMGARGGKARARAMTQEQRTEIARKVAAKRWGKF